MLPGAVLAPVWLAMPGRYLATAIWLGYYFMPTRISTTVLGSLFRWQLSWGLADVQGAGLVTLGLAGAVAWSRGTPASAVQGYRRLLAAEGGRLVVLVALAGWAAGAGAALAYALVLSMPASTWVLAAADGYAHYATLPVGLLLLAGLVELGERTLAETAKLAGGRCRARSRRSARRRDCAPENRRTLRGLPDDDSCAGSAKSIGPKQRVQFVLRLRIRRVRSRIVPVGSVRHQMRASLDRRREVGL